MSGNPRVESAPVLEQDDFIRGSVWPRLDAGAEPPKVELVHYRHGVVEYRFGSRLRVFAKPFPDTATGVAAYEIQRALWDDGFGTGSPYRVPEPIAYLPDQRVVLMGAASGQRLRELAKADPVAWHEGLRGAARWLAALHSSSLRLGPPDDSTRRALHLARRLAQTAKLHRDVETLIARLLDELAARTPTHSRSTPDVQTHGRYHPEHVYVASDHITVIDPDKASLGDPAKDLGEFLHRLRSDGMRAGLAAETRERGSAVFVEEYARASSTDLSELEFYWSYSVLWTVVGRAGRPEDARELARREFYEAEFAGIPARVAEYGLAPRGDL